MNFDSFWCSDYDPLLVSSHEQLLQLLLLPVYRLWYLHWRKGGGIELLNAVFWVMLIFSCSTHLPLLKAIFILSGGRRILCTVCRCPELLAMTRLLSCKWKQTMVHVAFTITFRIILLSIQIVLQIRTKCPDYLPPINIKFNLNLISQPAGRLFPPPQLWYIIIIKINNNK